MKNVEMTLDGTILTIKVDVRRVRSVLLASD